MQRHLLLLFLIAIAIAKVAVIRISTKDLRKVLPWIYGTTHCECHLMPGVKVQRVHAPKGSSHVLKSKSLDRRIRVLAVFRLRKYILAYFSRFFRFVKYKLWFELIWNISLHHSAAGLKNICFFQLLSPAPSQWIVIRIHLFHRRARLTTPRVGLRFSPRKTRWFVVFTQRLEDPNVSFTPAESSSLTLGKKYHGLWKTFDFKNWVTNSNFQIHPNSVKCYRLLTIVPINVTFFDPLQSQNKTKQAESKKQHRRISHLLPSLLPSAAGRSRPWRFWPRLCDGVPPGDLGRRGACVVGPTKRCWVFFGQLIFLDIDGNCGFLGVCGSNMVKPAPF